MTAETIAATVERFRGEPDAARATPSVTGRLMEGRAELTSGSYTWSADLPPALGGTGAAPSPTQYLLGALAGCAVAFIHDTLGPQLGIPVDDVTATARCRTDARGLLGIEGAIPDLQDIEIEIEVRSSASDRLGELRRVWEERCPIYLALVKACEVRVREAGSDDGAATS